jgi:hypothetical protein
MPKDAVQEKPLKKLRLRLEFEDEAKGAGIDSDTLHSLVAGEEIPEKAA